MRFDPVPLGLFLRKLYQRLVISPHLLIDPPRMSQIGSGLEIIKRALGYPSDKRVLPYGWQDGLNYNHPHFINYLPEEQVKESAEKWILLYA